MSGKLNHSDLSALLSKQAGISMAKAEGFTKAVFDLIIEGLEQDGIVKINGLGTFKVTEVADRFSVNVNTGEKFEIKGHKKLVFIPAESLKEAVNQPFAMFAPVEVDDRYQDDSDVQEGGDEQPEDEETAVAAEPHTTGSEAPLEEEVAEEVKFNLADVPEEMPAEESGSETASPVHACEIEEEECRVEDAPSAGSVASNEGTVAEPEDETAGEPEDETASDTGADEPVEEPAAAEDSVEENELHCAADCSGEDKTEDESSNRTPEQENTSEPSTGAKQQSGVADENPRRRRSGSKAVATIALMLLCGMAYYWFAGKENEEAAAEKRSRILADDKESQHSGSKNRGVVVDNLLLVEADGSDGSVPADESAGADASQDFAPSELANAPSQESAALDSATVAVAAEQEEYVFVMVAALDSVREKDVRKEDTSLYNITGTLAVHTVSDGENLAKISKIYYKSRKLWPYIAEHNSMSDPGEVSVGMKLSIPQLEPK